jgi:hypothetical protein
MLLFVCLAAMVGGCRNPIVVDSAASSPTKEWVSEVLSQDAAWLTEVKAQREYLVVVRPAAEARDANKHLVLRALGLQPPCAKWVAERRLEVSIPEGTEILDDWQRRAQPVDVVIQQMQHQP